MGNKLYVGNLAYSVDDSALQQPVCRVWYGSLSEGHYGPRLWQIKGFRVRGNGLGPGSSGSHLGHERQRSRRPCPHRHEARPKRKAAAAAVAAEEAVTAAAADAGKRNHTERLWF